MAIEIIWEESGVLYVNYSGTITGADATRAQENFGSDARFDDLKAIIIDGSGITENLYTDKDVEKISAIARAHSLSNANIKNAVIVDSSENGLALASFYKFLADESSWKIELFNNEEEARKWIES